MAQVEERLASAAASGFARAVDARERDHGAAVAAGNEHPDAGDRRPSPARTVAPRSFRRCERPQSPGRRPGDACALHAKGAPHAHGRARAPAVAQAPSSASSARAIRRRCLSASAADAEPSTGQDEQVVGGRRSDQPAVGRDGTRVVRSRSCISPGNRQDERNDVDRLRPAASRVGSSCRRRSRSRPPPRRPRAAAARCRGRGDPLRARRGQAADHHQPSLARGVHQLGLRAVDDGGSGRERRVGRGVEHPGRRRYPPARACCHADSDRCLSWRGRLGWRSFVRSADPR